MLLLCALLLLGCHAANAVDPFETDDVTRLTASMFKEAVRAIVLKGGGKPCLTTCPLPHACRLVMAASTSSSECHNHLVCLISHISASTPILGLPFWGSIL